MSIVFRAPRRYRETSQAELGDNISCDGKKEFFFALSSSRNLFEVGVRNGPLFQLLKGAR